VSNASEITIRRAEIADADQLAELAADTFALGCPRDSRPEDVQDHVEHELSQERFHADLSATGVAIYLGSMGEQLGGYAVLLGDEPPPIPLDFRRPVQLRRLYVREEFHGKGVSHALLRRCVRHARTHDYDLMWLGSNQENERALAFYARHKFEIVGNREFALGPSIECDHVLARGIDQPEG
jgi:GNAT superfamily N-acetyltransferase